MANKIDFGANSHVENPSKSEAFFSKFKKQILIAVVAIIVIVAGAVLYNAYVSGPREDKASTALAKGQQYFNQEQFAEYLGTGEYLERRKTRDEDIIRQDGKNTIEKHLAGDECRTVIARG